MISIQSAVEEILANQPVISSLLQQDLLNLSALAKQWRSDVEKICQKPVTNSAVTMALSRYEGKNTHNLIVDFRPLVSSLHLRKNIVELCYLHSPSIHRSLAKLSHLLEIKEKQFFTITQGIGEVMICAPEANTAQIKNILRQEKLHFEGNQLNSLTLTLADTSIDTVGLYAQILTRIALLGVAIVDVVSTTKELTIILLSRDTQKVLGIFQG